MNRVKKDQCKPKSTTPVPGNSQTRTVRGSGFTYTEDRQPTDKSVPLENADQEDIVQLPDLGKKNRP
jgi:hypothetical protein